MQNWWLTPLAAAIGYLVGSVPFGYLMGRRHGIDIREYGSQNIGATNVLRILGSLPALLVLIFDVGKGALPVWLAAVAGGSVWVQIAAGVGALAGHTWPFTLKFRGGRAVATSLGLIAVLSPLAALCAAGSFAVVVAITRYVSLGSMVGAIAAAVMLPVFHAPAPVVGLGIGVALLVVYRHRPNIERLRKGTEAKIGQRVVIPATEEEQPRARQGGG